MKTLAKLWEEAGQKPFKVKKPGWKPGCYFECVGISPFKFAVGWHSVGPVEVMESDKPEWILYSE